MTAKNWALCLLTGFLTGAVFTWPLSSGESEIWGIDHRFYLVIAIILLGFLLRRIIKKSPFSPPALLVAFGAVLAPALQMLYEVLGNSTSGDLRLLTLIFYILLVFPAAFLGAFLEQMYRRVRKGQIQR